MRAPFSELILEGVRQNNLRNLSLRLPHNKVIAITGVSGSGKSSLAFDTIFAEGQWRFIESLSTYARLFLEKLNRPDADAIRNIRPAIALEQKNPVRGSRSTVGTMTEAYDLLRLLYARIAEPFCPTCGTEIRKWDASQIIEELLSRHENSRAMVLFGSGESLQALAGRGFRRIWRDGNAIEIHDAADRLTPPFDVILDRIVVRPGARLADSIELAWKEGRGRLGMLFAAPDGTFTRRDFSSDNTCELCGISLPDPSALLFSFNHPVGACPVCKGFGDTLRYDEDLIVPNKDLTLEQGAVEPWTKPAARWWKKQLLTKGKKAGIELDIPFRDLPASSREILFKGIKGFYGIDDFFGDLEDRRYKLHVRVFLSRYRRASTCPSCAGKRLTKEALAYKVGNKDIAELCRMPVSVAIEFFNALELSPMKRGISRELLRQIMAKLMFLAKVGLEYLTLDRYGKTLSGGEYQRVNLSNQLASLLTGTLYVLDEPTVGLHARDTERVVNIMKQLSELGNTVIVVEHDRKVIRSADWLVELGPGGGQRGGEIVYNGSQEGFAKANTLTARYLRGEEEVFLPPRTAYRGSRMLILRGATGHNLKDIDLQVPLGTLCVVSGVSGTGKSSLVVETLYRALMEKFGHTSAEPALPFMGIEGAEFLSDVRLIDQSAIGKTPRSNAVTYLKIFEHIRKLFAEQPESRAAGHGPGFFSFNVPGGRCETCKGEGHQLLEMYFFEDLYVTCEKCGGTRYGPEAMRVRYRGKNIHEVLQMTVEEARALFSDHAQICQRLDLMIATGLGYLRLGQSATTLSGGEAQRMKICSEIASVSNRNLLYIMDEPTVGLHFADIQALLNILGRLVDAGNTVLVIEHNLEVIRAADWAIDLGPEGGDAGGEILYQGHPAGLADEERSYTGRYLANSEG